MTRASFLKFIKLSPFKLGCMVVLASVLLFHSFGDQKPLLIATLDNRLTDAMFRWRGPMSTTNSVVIVDIDNKSLAEIGQWPWPRDVMADLGTKIHKAGARSIGFDILFAEPDRTSPGNNIEELAKLLEHSIPKDELKRLQQNEAIDHDLIFGDALARIPSVLGYAFETGGEKISGSGAPFPSCNIRFDPPNVRIKSINFIKAKNAILNINDISQGESEGFFSVFPDPSGTVRKVPLFMEYNGIPYPSLALETLRVGLGEEGVTIHVSKKNNSIYKVSVAGKVIPTDERGQVSVNFRGYVKKFPYVSAVDILEGKSLERLRGKFVLIGTSAPGLRDLKATPFSSNFPGVEVHANVIDNLMAGDPLVYDAYTEIAMTYLFIIVGGIMLCALLAFSTPLSQGLGWILYLVATVAGAHFFFLHNSIIGITYPLVTIVFIILIVTLFNYFFEGREKKFIHNAFGRYVSPQVVSEIVKNPGSLSLSGQVKNLTVFFSDIRDFTSVSEQMTPEQLGYFMNRYLTEMSDIIMANGGTVDKFIGDAIMAIWGAPVDDHDHSAKAIRTSLGIISTLGRLQKEWEEEGLPVIKIGIGLNTGEMSVGNFGSNQRFDYTVLGDNVNLASRLEGLTKVYGTQILISESTMQEAGNRFFCRFIDRVRVKGKELPVNIYEPLCEGEPAADLRQEVAEFEEAFREYQEGNFLRADSILTDLYSRNPLKLYTLFHQRVDKFVQVSPTEDWDGVFTFTKK